MRRAGFVVLLAAALAGCGSAQTKEDKHKNDPVVSRQPLDAPPAEAVEDPPLGKPRAKVPPSAMDKRSESLLRDDPAH